jgi:uncharacterized protein
MWSEAKIMEKILISQIARAENATISIQFKDFIPELETLTPVQGAMKISHGGSFLEIQARAWTIITLICDRTLVQFNHRLEVDTKELILLGEEIPASQYAKEIELNFSELNETLSPNGHFEPSAWLYEQLCLNIPFQKIAPDAPDLDFVDSVPNAASQVDKRWAALASLYTPE